MFAGRVVLNVGGGAGASASPADKISFLDACRRLSAKDPYLTVIDESFFQGLFSHPFAGRGPGGGDALMQGHLHHHHARHHHLQDQQHVGIRLRPEDYGTFQQALLESQTLTKLHLDFAWFWEEENVRFAAAGPAFDMVHHQQQQGGGNGGDWRNYQPRVASAVATAIRQNPHLKDVQLKGIRGSESLRRILLACACSTSISSLDLQYQVDQEVASDIPLAGSENLLDFAATCPLRYLLQSTKTLTTLRLQSRSAGLLDDVTKGLVGNKTLKSLTVQGPPHVSELAQAVCRHQTLQSFTAVNVSFFESPEAMGWKRAFQATMAPVATTTMMTNTLQQPSQPLPFFALEELTLAGVGPKAMEAVIGGRVKRLVLQDFCDNDEHAAGVEEWVSSVRDTGLRHRISEGLKTSTLQELVIHASVQYPPSLLGRMLAVGLQQNQALTHLHIHGVHLDWNDCRRWKTTLATNTTLQVWTTVNCSAANLGLVVEGLVQNTSLTEIALDVTPSSPQRIQHREGDDPQDGSDDTRLGSLLTALEQNQVAGLKNLRLRMHEPHPPIEPRPRVPRISTNGRAPRQVRSSKVKWKEILPSDNAGDDDAEEDDKDGNDELDQSEAARIQRCLAHNTSLEELNLTHFGTDLDHDLDRLAQGLQDGSRTSALKVLRIQSNTQAVQASSVTHFLTALKDHETLVTVALGFSMSASAALASRDASARLLRNHTSLRDLQVCGRLASRTLVSGLEENQVLTTLTLLDVDETDLEEIGSSLAKNGSVQYLEIRALASTNVAFHDFIGHLPKMHGLEAIKLNVEMSDELWLPALRQNPRLQSIHPRRRGVGRPCQLVDYYLRLNACGRWLLYQSDLPVGLWPHLLERTTQPKDAACLFYMLKGKAGMMEGASRSKRKRIYEKDDEYSGSPPLPPAAASFP